MIAVCLYSFSHEVPKGRAGSVIRVTQCRIDTVGDTLQENMALLTLRPHARAMLRNKELKSLEMFLFLCEKGFNAQQSFLAFTVSCVKWT